MRTAGEELAATRPEEFKALVLGVMAGLRRNEIDKLEWGHFNWAAGTINVAPTEFLHIKSEMSARTVWPPPEMLEAFRGYWVRASGRFVIESVVKPSTNREHYRCAGVFERLIAWLRAHGVTGQKPLHAMRKESVAWSRSILVYMPRNEHSDTPVSRQPRTTTLRSRNVRSWPSGHAATPKMT